jgi:diguanylate cyclase (GGDEF)-like protein
MPKSSPQRRGRADLRARVKELEAEVRHLETLAFTDPLTGLYNRRGLDRALEAAFASADGPVSCLLIDLDRFKEVNDLHGHLAGDQMLRRVAAHLRASCRATDDVGRFGGDEFLVILPGVDETTARARLGSLLLALRDSAAAPWGISASGGWATSRRRGPQAIVDLITSADRRLLRSKPLQDRGILEAPAPL